MDPLQDKEKWDFAVIYYTLARSEVSKKTHFWVSFWDRLGDKIVESRVPEQHQKSAENRHPFYEIWGRFWGSFWSKKSVVCRSKMSLTCGPLKIVILAPSGHPKSTKFEVIVWCNFDRFSDDGDTQCIRINALFSKELMLFQQFCCSVVGGY